MMDGERMMDGADPGLALALMGFGVLVTLLALAVAVWLALRSPDPDGAGQRTSARQLLEERLASGEISPEEYYERESALRSARPVGRSRGVLRRL